MTGTPADRLAYTYDDAARAVGVSVKVIRRAVRAGHLAPVYPTSRPVILADDLADWLRSRPASPPGT